MEINMVMQVLRKGRRNLNLARNLKQTSKATPTGAKSFLTFCPNVGSIGRPSWVYCRWENSFSSTPKGFMAAAPRSNELLFSIFKIARHDIVSVMILVLDNYDSFTYNLVQYLGELGAETVVKRNDEISLDEIRKLKPERILVSPGPCSPRESGLSNDVIRTFSQEGVPVFGVCLGHQCIGHTFGANVKVNYRMMHGKTSPI